MVQGLHLSDRQRADGTWDFSLARWRCDSLARRYGLRRCAAVPLVGFCRLLVGNIDPQGHAGSTSSLVWATVANTMPTSFWALYFLLTNPDALAARDYAVSPSSATRLRTWVALSRLCLPSVPQHFIPVSKQTTLESSCFLSGPACLCAAAATSRE
jgi:hypothetical protein